MSLPPTSERPAVAPSALARADRRVHRRARLDRPVLLETDARSGNARGLDVCAGGIAVRTDLPLAPEDVVSVYFELPIGYAVETQAVVVRREGDLVGLRFVDAPREVIVAVRGFCRISGVMPAAPTS